MANRIDELTTSRKGGGVPLGIEILARLPGQLGQRCRKGGGVPLGIEMRQLL